MSDSCPTDDLKVAGRDALGAGEKGFPTGETAPLIHRFQTQANHYVYDVNTRRILRVSNVVWDVLEDFGSATSDEILARHSETHGRRQVVAALEEIEATRGRGLLLSSRPSRLLRDGGVSIEQFLEDRRTQLILNVTEECNFRCTYCVYSGEYENFRPHSHTSMSWDVARKAIDEFLAHCGGIESPVISFYGGEPLLSMDLIRQCVAHARQQCPREDLRFSVTTNGSLLTGEIADFLAKEQFLVTVSIDGPSEVHDRHRRTRTGDATWERVTANIRSFLERFGDYRTNGRFRFSAVASPDSDLREVEEFCASCNLFSDSMGMSVSVENRPGDSTPLSTDAPLSVSLREIRKTFVEDHKSGKFGPECQQPARWIQTGLLQKRLLLFHKRGFLSPGLPEEMSFLNTCMPGVRKTFVSVDGDYYACERVLHVPAQRIGNVTNGVEPDQARRVLNEWMDPNSEQCRHCWCLSHCLAGCMAMVDGDGRATPEAKARLCAANRRAAHRNLVEYCEILEANPKAFEYMGDYDLG
jgi:uncharacterized protein